MQSNNKEIYRLTAERTGVDEKVYKDIGSAVFESLYRKMRRPPSIIIGLRGVGNWYLRRKRMDIQVNVFTPDLEKENFHSKLGEVEYRNRIEMYHIFKARLEEYEQFIKERNEIRKIRYESQVLLEPNNGENESPETSKADPS